MLSMRAGCAGGGALRSRAMTRVDRRRRAGRTAGAGSRSGREARDAAASAATLSAARSPASIALTITTLGAWLSGPAVARSQQFFVLADRGALHSRLVPRQSQCDFISRAQACASVRAPPSLSRRRLDSAFLRARARSPRSGLRRRAAPCASSPFFPPATWPPHSRVPRAPAVLAAAPRPGAHAEQRLLEHHSLSPDLRRMLSRFRSRISRPHSVTPVWPARCAEFDTPISAIACVAITRSVWPPLHGLHTRKRLDFNAVVA